MDVLAALGDAPTAAIAVAAILLCIFVVVRGTRGERAEGEKPAPSLLAVPVPATGPDGGGADPDDGLQRMAVHDIGHGTIRLVGVTPPDPSVPTYAPQLPPTEPAPARERAAAEPETEAREPEPGPEAGQSALEAGPAQREPEVAEPEPESPPPEPQPPAWMALRPPPPAPVVPQTWGSSQTPAAAEEPEPAPEPAPWSPPQTLAPEPESRKSSLRPGRLRLRKKPQGD
ncbi:MAG TPA: hypothetical protein VNA28_02940 [Solirubrobacteraceae bacterium]|nr:hypothetical protein [Solirubrobacteraceae bacterium]